MLLLLPGDVHFLIGRFLSAQDVAALACSSSASSQCATKCWPGVFSTLYPNTPNQWATISAFLNTSKEEAWVTGVLGSEKGGGSFHAADVLKAMQSLVGTFDKRNAEWEQEWCKLVVSDRLDSEQYADSIAQFVFNNLRKLNRTRVSNFLSARLDRRVLKYFVSKFDFRGMQFDWALRAIIALINLPSSNKGVDRILHCFGQTYMDQNGMINATDSDELYTAGFSLILLSTDLHNPRVIEKMGEAAWITSCRTVLRDSLFGDDTLRRMYRDAKECPIVLNVGEFSKSGEMRISNADLSKLANLSNPTDSAGGWMQRCVDVLFLLVACKFVHLLLLHFCSLSSGLKLGLSVVRVVTSRGVLSVYAQADGKDEAFQQPIARFECGCWSVQAKERTALDKLSLGIGSMFSKQKDLRTCPLAVSFSRKSVESNPFFSSSSSSSSLSAARNGRTKNGKAFEGKVIFYTEAKNHGNRGWLPTLQWNAFYRMTGGQFCLR